MSRQILDVIKRVCIRLLLIVWLRLPSVFRARLKAWRNPTRYPKMVFIEPTTRCNLKCTHCGRTYWKDRSKIRDMEFETFAKLVAELKELGVPAITIQGLGEPLMHKRIFDMIDCAQQAGLYSRFNTNLTLLSDENAERLVRSGHSEVAVSIESIDPETFADIRRGTTLDVVLGNLEKLCNTKKRLNSETPLIRVSAVVFKKTMDQIQEFGERMKAIGITSLNFQGLNTQGIDPESRLKDGSRMVDQSLADLPSEEVDAVIARLKSLEDEHMVVQFTGDIGGCGSQHRPARGIKTCWELWEGPYVDSAGRVTPCCFLPDGVIVTLGDLNKQSFKEVWLGEPYRQLRLQHLTNRHPDYCKNCQELIYLVTPPARLFSAPADERLYGAVFLGRDK